MSQTAAIVRATRRIGRTAQLRAAAGECVSALGAPGRGAKNVNGSNGDDDAGEQHAAGNAENNWQRVVGIDDGGIFGGGNGSRNRRCC